MGADSRELDDQHVADLARRDRVAVRVAYEALADPLYRYLRARCGQDELAADIVGETFVELVRSAPSLQGGVSGLRRWLFTAARHNLLDELRKRGRHAVLVPLDPTEEPREAPADTQPPVTPTRPLTPEEHYALAERDAEIRRALATLREDHREVLELRFAAELSAAEAGEVMGRSAGAVRVLQHRALRALASALDERGPEGTQGPARRGEAATDRISTAPTRGPPGPRP